MHPGELNHPDFNPISFVVHKDFVRKPFNLVKKITKRLASIKARD